MRNTTKQRTLARICYENVFAENENSQSNGGLMRITPLAAYISQLQNEALIEKIIRAEQHLTHCNETALQASITYSLSIRELINHEGDRKKAWSKVDEWIQKKGNEDIRDFKKTVNDNYLMDANYQMGWCKIAWTLTFIHLKREKIDYLNSMKEILMMNGDTDTNAAIVGGMLGASIGINELYRQAPQQVEILLKCDKLKNWRPDLYTPRKIVEMTENILNYSENLSKNLELQKEIEDEIHNLFTF